MKERQTALRQFYEKEIKTYINKRDAYSAERKKSLGDKKKDFAQKTAALEAIEEPQAPLTPMLICAEPTIEGLAKALVGGHPSVGVFTSEGGAFLGGHGFGDEAKLRTAAGLSLFWDSGEYNRVRAKDGYHDLVGRRLSIHVQVQPHVATLMFADDLLNDQGLTARILTAAPESRQGQRKWKEVAPEHIQALNACHDRLDKLFKLKLPVKQGTLNELDPIALTFSDDARTGWINFSDSVEAQLGPGGALVSIPGFAAKMAEHAARLAAVLRLLEDPSATTIELEDLERGIKLVRYYAKTALRL